MKFFNSKITTSEILLEAINNIQKNKDYNVCAILSFIECIRTLDKNRLKHVVEFTKSISVELLEKEKLNRN